MTPLQDLYYAIGELAYAIARADGSVQKEEREKFHEIVAAELRCKEFDFDISDIIFQILDKDKYADAQTSYDWAMKQIRLNSHYLSPHLKETFIKVMDKVAKAFPPVTQEEINILGKFKMEISTLEGDPVYYSQNKR